MREHISVWLSVSRSFLLLFLFICFYSNRTNEVLNKNNLNTLVATSSGGLQKVRKSLLWALPVAGCQGPICILQRIYRIILGMFGPLS